MTAQNNDQTNVISPLEGGEHTNIGPSRLTFSVEEAAKLLGVSRAFGYELVARGEIPSIRLGRRLLVPCRALISLLEQCK